MNEIMIASMPNNRIQKLIEELKYALNHSDTYTLTTWGLNTGELFLKSLSKRGVGFYKTIDHLTKFATQETKNTINAIKKGEIKSYAAERSNQFLTVLNNKKNQVIILSKEIALRIKSNPRTMAPELFMAMIGFFLGSGGLDGDGGIPDLDLQLGIGFHRSIWFHSILPGVMIETIVFSLVSLVKLIYQQLPKEHDELWDRFVSEYTHLSVAFASGTCAGIAYHLMIDATWDGGKAYSDLPFNTSIAGHQTIMGGNALAEGAGVFEKNLKVK